MKYILKILTACVVVGYVSSYVPKLIFKDNITVKLIQLDIKKYEVVYNELKDKSNKDFDSITYSKDYKMSPLFDNGIIKGLNKKEEK